VRQGRTDAWIAHQLEVSASELREFRRRHELDSEEEVDETDLRDEIEAQIEAATREDELAAEEADDDEDADDDDAHDSEPDDAESDDAGSDPEQRDGGKSGRDRGSDPSRSREKSGDSDRPKRRRRRRGGRGRSSRAGASMQASFDHGEEGYGLWLDPAIADDPIYTEHWAGHRPLEVTVEPDRIVIKRSGDADADGNGDDDNGADSDDD